MMVGLGERLWRVTSKANRAQGKHSAAKRDAFAQDTLRVCGADNFQQQIRLLVSKQPLPS